MLEVEMIKQRLIGKYEGKNSGKLFVAIAGIHGNEKTGLDALERIFRRLEEDQPDFNGTIVGIAGNLRAINENTRYFDVDLNRIWTEEFIREIKSTSVDDMVIHEYKEMKSLLSEIDNVTRGVEKENIRDKLV